MCCCLLCCPVLCSAVAALFFAVLCCAVLYAGRVLLLTNPVVGGYVQNPISVYYCFDGSSNKLAKCIAEVRQQLVLCQSFQLLAKRSYWPDGAQEHSNKY